jgi:hypothetical protein
MTDQEIFDTVAKHLLTQKAKALSENGTCAYRGENGTKCAVGCLISDEDYFPSIEGKVVTGLFRDFGEKPAINQLKSNEILLIKLQSIHDKWPVSEWPNCLAALARRNVLSPFVLSEFSK